MNEKCLSDEFQQEVVEKLSNEIASIIVKRVESAINNADGFKDKPRVEKFDPKTLQPFDKVLVRYNKCSPWIPNIFGQMNDTTCCCISGSWTICIPYNEKTKHLIGKINDCPNYYKWWKD